MLWDTSQYAKSLESISLIMDSILLIFQGKMKTLIQTQELVVSLLSDAAYKPLSQVPPGILELLLGSRPWAKCYIFIYSLTSFYR